jgi:hypothetical protein
MDKENGIRFSPKKKGTPVTSNNTDEPQGCFAK